MSSKLKLSTLIKLRSGTSAFAAGLLLWSALQPGVFALTPQGERKIVSEDFTKNRKEGVPAASNSQAMGGSIPDAKAPPRKPAPRTYRLASKSVPVTKPATATKPVAETKAPPKTKPAESPEVAQLGVTIWKLRPVAANDTGARMLVRQKNRSSELMPVRVESETVFNQGDQLRLSIESARSGYLYVIDRELFTDGSMGPAMLIYPWANMSGDNQVRPGKLIDIPAQDDDPSFFTASPSKPNQVGEVLTIIVTSSPLNLPIADQPIEISRDDLEKWEKSWSGDTDRFEMEGGAGETWTTQEQQAAASKGTRQLTRNDPAPQTIYRVSSADNKAFLVNVRLSYSR